MEKIKKFFGHPFVQFLGPTGVFVMITWVITKAAQLPLWVIWLAILITIVCVIWIVIGFRVWAQSRERDFRHKRDTQIMAILRKWTDKRQYLSAPRADDATVFRFVVTDSQNRKLQVFKSKDNLNVLHIAMFPDEKQMGVVPEPYQSAARYSINLEMARIGLKCDPQPPMCIESELQCDEFLTESSFWNAIDKMRQGHVLVSAYYAKALQEAETEKQKPSASE